MARVMAKLLLSCSLMHRMSLVDVGSVEVSGFGIKALIDKSWISTTITLLGNNVLCLRSGVCLDAELAATEELQPGK